MGSAHSSLQLMSTDCLSLRWQLKGPGLRQEIHGLEGSSSYLGPDPVCFTPPGWAEDKCAPFHGKPRPQARPLCCTIPTVNPSSTTSLLRSRPQSASI